MGIQTRERIIAAARSLAMESSRARLSAARIAKSSEVARTSLYDYFPSVDELLAEVLLLELQNYRNEVSVAINKGGTPLEIVTLWVRANLAFIIDGRHTLARGLMPIAARTELRDEIRAAHIQLYGVLEESLCDSGLKISQIQFAFMNSVIETAAKRIEGGTSASDVEAETTAFITAGLRLVTS